MKDDWDEDRARSESALCKVMVELLKRRMPPEPKQRPERRSSEPEQLRASASTSSREPG